MYVYTASKRELYEQRVRFVMHHWQNKVKASVALETDAKNRLNVLFSTALNYLSGDADFCSLLKKDPSIFPMFLSEGPYSGINERSVVMIEDILNESIASGAFRSLAVRPAAEVIFSMYKGFIIQAYVNGEERYLEKYTASAVELLTRGQDQITLISDLITELLPHGGRVGIETGMSNYTPEGFLTYYEFMSFKDALPDCELINAHYIIDDLAIKKDDDTINRFRKASEIADAGHVAVHDAIKNGGWRGLTESDIAGIAALAMRKTGSVREWSFTGGACTPASLKKIEAGEPLMVDIHALYMLA